MRGSRHRRRRDRVVLGLTIVGAVAVLTVVTLLAFAARDGMRPMVAPTSSTRTSAPATATTTSASTTTVAPSTTTTEPTTSTTAPPSDVLQQGASGDAVLALQQRLTDLGYWLPSVDGMYGSDTAHAVTAFQKANDLARDGIAGPLTLDALATSTRVVARSSEPVHVEIDLTRQLLVYVGADATWVFDTSTGRVAGTTPTGDFTIFRQVNGYDRSPLGVLYRPKYFTGGVAIHGYPSVPPYPASHGCVRVTNAAMDWFWATGALPIGTPVSVYR